MSKTYNKNRNKQKIDDMQSAPTNKICRACLNILSESAGHSLFDALQLAEKFSSCSTLTKLIVDDSLPKMLCTKCKNKLISFYEFQVMCLASDKYLRGLNIAKMDELKLDLPKNNFIEMQYNATIEEEQRSEQSLGRQKSNDLSIIQKQNYLQCVVKIESDIEMNTENDTPYQIDEIESVNVPSQSSSTNTTIAKIEDDCKKEFQNDALDQNDTTYVPLETSSDEDDSELESENDPLDQDDNDYVPLKHRKKRNADLTATYQCDQCSKGFAVEHRLIAHQREHQGLVPYPCTHIGCDKGFKRKDVLSRHIKLQHEEKQRIFACNQTDCNETFLQKKSLEVHLRDYHKIEPEPEPFICEICGKFFKQSANLKVHMMRHAGIKNYECPYCGDRKTTSGDLKMHINTHTRERTWSCRHCTKVFKTLSHRISHERTVHEGVKNFPCSYCKDSFTTARELKYHEMRHTGEKPHECGECGRRFRQPAALRTHRKIHDRQRAGNGNESKRKGAKNLTCSYCERTFSAPRELKYHEMSHTGEKPHECTECGTHFRWPNALRKHLKMHERQKAGLPVDYNEVGTI